MSDDKKNIDPQKFKTFESGKLKKEDKKDKFKKIINRCEELEHKYKLALADYQNLIKRTTIEKQEFVKYANEQLLLEILPVYDNLKISLAHTDKQAEKNGWIDGVKHVIKQFRGALESMGIEEINTKESKFDPTTMEAIEGKGDKVKKEVKPGYKLNGKVIVPARVILE